MFGYIYRWILKILSRPKESDTLELPSPSYPSPPSSSGSENYMSVSMAWGKKVSPEFRDRVAWIAKDLGMDANHLMSVMAFESGETFSSSIKNMAGSGATGLIQFMPATAIGLGTTTDALAAMTPSDQLNWVHGYFKPYKGRLRTLSDVYMAVLWPRGVGQPEDYVLWSQASRPTTYRQNAGLDVNRDGVITKREAASKVQGKLERGMTDSFRFDGRVYPNGRNH